MAFFIAEIGINHGGSIDKALRLIDEAALSGCNSVKFQTYTTENRVGIDSPIFEILKSCELDYASFEKLDAHAKEQGLEFFSTAFDEDAVEVLNSLGVKYHKAASFDLVNSILLKKMASSGKNVLVSTGMGTLDDLNKVDRIFQKSDSDLIFLHCVSSYPLKESDANLKQISTIKYSFPHRKVGYSDHTPDIKVPLYAVCLGAEVIEKHFMLKEDFDCVDAPVSIDFEKMKTLIKKSQELTSILGNPDVEELPSENSARIYRRFS
jgi:N,N'-diacetyllegionaminate synthase